MDEQKVPTVEDRELQSVSSDAPNGEEQEKESACVYNSVTLPNSGHLTQHVDHLDFSNFSLNEFMDNFPPPTTPPPVLLSLSLFLLPSPSLPTILGEASCRVSLGHEKGAVQKAGGNPELAFTKQSGWTC